MCSLKMKINIKALALTGGIIWGLTLFVITLISLKTTYADSFLIVIMSIYQGFKVTLLGSLIGLVYGLVYGFIFLWLIGWLYNKLVR